MPDTFLIFAFIFCSIVSIKKFKVFFNALWVYSVKSNLPFKFKIIIKLIIEKEN